MTVVTQRLYLDYLNLQRESICNESVCAMSKREEAERRNVKENLTGLPSNEPTTDRHRLFSSMFFGRQSNRSEEDDSDSRNLNPPNVDDGREVLRSQEPISAAVLGKGDPVSAAVLGKGDVEHETSPSNQIDEILSQVDKQIPHDPIALRQTSLYKGALQVLQWQRDNYLVGTEYADWRKNDRQRQQDHLFHSPDVESYYISYDDKALGHNQIAQVASDFIPTSTVKNALTPVVTELFAPEGALYDPIKNALAGVILGQQNNLEQTIKNQMLHFLDNPQNREAMKNSTQGMLIQTTKTDSQRKKANST